MSKRKLINTLNKNSTAWCIACALIIIAFLTGGARPLNKMRSDREKIFYSGSEAKTFDIRKDLLWYAEHAANLLTISGNYLSESDSSLSGVHERRAELAAAKSVKDMSRAYFDLVYACESLYQTLSEKMLSESHAKYAAQIIADLQSTSDIIAREASIYNEAARDFNKSLNSWPAAFFKVLRLTKPIELFAVELN